MGFINLNRLLDLNKDDVDRMGQTVADNAKGDIEGANKAIMQYGANPIGAIENPMEKVAKAQAKATMLGSTGGVASTLGTEAQKVGQYTAGGGLLDAFLAGNSQAVQGLQKSAQGMGERYDASQKSAQEVTNQYAQMAQKQQEEDAARSASYQAAAARKPMDDYNKAKAAYQTLIDSGQYTSQSLAASQQALNIAEANLAAWRKAQAGK